MSLSTHHLHDILLYIPFLAGELLYILKRASFSMRAGRVTTRWHYVWLNWDVLLFRTVAAFVCIYTPFRHYSPGDLLALFHYDISATGSLSFLATPISSPVAMLALGMAADGLLDWIVDWASRDENTKVPKRIKDWLKENVEQMPMAQS